MGFDQIQYGQMKKMIEYWLENYAAPHDMMIVDWRLGSGLGINSYTLVITVRSATKMSPDAAWFQSNLREFKKDLNDLAFDIYLHKDIVMIPTIDIDDGGKSSGP